MVKVLIVEDSPVTQEFLTHILATDPEIQVVGTAQDGQEALEAVARLRPNVITMDIHTPRSNGFDATRRIMESCPTPTIMLSNSHDAGEVAISFQALEAGAVAVLPCPAGIGHPDHAHTARELVQTVKLMAEVKVVRRWPKDRHRGLRPTPNSPTPNSPPPPGQAEMRLVVIGASTGGPIALQTILSRLPASFSVPLVIVQHMAQGFVQGFVEWLAASTGRRIVVGSHGQPILEGHAYVAPDHFHMDVTSDGRLSLSRCEEENGLCPAVSRLFRSAAHAYGKNAAGVLLTGMGKDGANELKLMKERGAITIAQDEESAVVHGMPGEAIRLGAASYILPPARIATKLAELAQKNKKR